MSNFRSIKDAIFELTSNCLILIGKKEAGKINILKAIAGDLDSKEYKIMPKDKRKRLPKEKIREDQYIVRCFLELFDYEMKHLFSVFLTMSIACDTVF